MLIYRCICIDTYTYSQTFWREWLNSWNIPLRIWIVSAIHLKSTPHPAILIISLSVFVLPAQLDCKLLADSTAALHIILPNSSAVGIIRAQGALTPKSQYRINCSEDARVWSALHCFQWTCDFHVNLRSSFETLHFGHCYYSTPPSIFC